MIKHFLVALIFMFSTPLFAQENSRAILVLDGSGSMWGQIDGKAKITIAQDVIGELLQSLPVQQELGLTVYGHRTKGSCTDIETIIEPGPDQQDTIAAAVNTIKPKGKTPMTDAVIAAAQALRYTEDKATVILVSDGIETCHPDPCAAARALEDAGVDFTAHVVGFNITDPEAIAQMQCLADETGGTFLSADNADELAEALVTVSATPEPEPVPVEITFSATLEVNGPEITQGLHWSIRDGLAESATPGGNFTHNFLPGQYSVTVLRLEDDVSVSAPFSVEELTKRVVLVLPKIVLLAQLEAVETAPIGSTVDVGWSAQSVSEGDYISIANSDQKAGQYLAYTYVAGSGALPVKMPLIPGEYELRYIRNAGGAPDEILTTHAIVVTDLSAQLEAPDEVGAGSEFEVVWTGPNYKNDYISIALPEDNDNNYAAYDYTEGGTTSDLTAPLDPGTYEIRYVANGSPDRVLGKRTILVVETSAGLEAPDQATAGNEVAVTWEGPDNKTDYISVAAIGENANKYVNYSYTQQGSPATVKMPLDPGSYELRYIAAGNPDQILAMRLIEIVAAEVIIEAPDEAIAGGIVEVTWSGPDNKSDYISVALPNESANNYTHYRYTANGNPAVVTMPLDPGKYELRYIANGSPDQVLATRIINIVAAQGALDAPDQAVAGDTLQVNWTGPDNKGDYVSIALAADKANKYAHYRYTANGNPAAVKIPLEPGSYELRYILNGSPDQVLASKAIEVVSAQVALEAPAQGTVGSEISVSYIGPDFNSDYISIAEIGSDSGKYISYQNTARGNPVVLKLPDVPGTFLIRYVASGSPDRVLARQTIKVVVASAEPAVVAVLEANETALAGSEVEVFWVGPDEQGDVIVISPLGSTDRLSETATASGNPAKLTLPGAPGQYMLHYMSGQSLISLGSRPLTVK